MKNKQKFSEAINEFYSKEMLFKLFKKYFLDWIAEGYIGSSLGLFEISMITENSNKQTFLDLIDQMYKKDNFITIFSLLPEEVKKAFIEIAWNGKFYIKENREFYLKQETTYDLSKKLKDDFQFFKIEKSGKKGEYLTLDYNIIRKLRKMLDEKPEDYSIHEAKNVISEFFRSDEKEFMENIKIYYNFYKQGGVVLSSSGKILKESKINMKKYCNISEYYEDVKDLQYLKTESIGLLFHLIKDDFINSENFNISNIKEVIRGFISGSIIKSEKYHYSFLYLNYLKGLKNIWKNEEQLSRALKTLEKVIKEITVTELYNPIISLENIIKRVVYQDDFIELINPQDAYDYIYINEANYERTKISCYEKYIEYIISPFIKSVLFILGVMGVFEIYYDSPSNNNSLYLKNGHLSKYDGLKYIRFTQFGKYIFDIVDDYKFDIVKDEGELILDEDRLIITILGESPSKAMFCEKISQKISNNKFKVSKEYFLKDINTSSELIKRIEVFKEKIKEEIPEIWKQFFNELLNKSDDIKIVSDYIVLKLKNEKSLLKTIATDERFRSLILKGEDYHVLIKADNLMKVIEIFKEYGYNIENLNVN
ncbi:MAG: hypothetical protein ACRC0K_02620 [Fusobacteriaceae bacterium]